MPVEDDADGFPDLDPRLSDALNKSLCDPFNYALRLRTGELIYYSEAKVDGDWLHPSEAIVTVDRLIHGGLEVQRKDAMPRGIDVRISDITWACDAPWGS